MDTPPSKFVIEESSKQNTAAQGKNALEDETEEDIIEQTFGMGDVLRNGQVFNDPPTPKSRMKREIDVEKETVVQMTLGKDVALSRAKIFEEAAMR